MGADIVYTPEDLKNVTYVSADESIAKVEEGKVIGVAEGNTTITASWTDGHSNSRYYRNKPLR